MTNTTHWNYLCREIAYGRALWALLSANEIFEVNDPLRLALVTRAKRRITYLAPFADLVFQGKTLSELPAEAVYQLRSVESSARKERPAVLARSYSPVLRNPFLRRQVIRCRVFNRVSRFGSNLAERKLFNLRNAAESTRTVNF